MQDPLQFILRKAHHNDVLLALSRSSPEELEELTQQYSPDRKDECINSIEVTLMSLKNHGLLIIGALMLLALSLLDKSYRTKYIQECGQKLNTSKTQIYRAMAIWKAYGKLMLEEQELLPMFTAAALDITSRDDVPEAARLEVIKLARQGAFITIKLAKSICVKHGVIFKKKVVPLPVPVPPPVIVPKEFIFKGNLIQIVWEKQEAEDGDFYREVEQAFIALRDYIKISPVVQSKPQTSERRQA